MSSPIFVPETEGEKYDDWLRFAEEQELQHSPAWMYVLIAAVGYGLYLWLG